MAKKAKKSKKTATRRALLGSPTPRARRRRRIPRVVTKEREVTL